MVQGAALSVEGIPPSAECQDSDIELRFDRQNPPDMLQNKNKSPSPFPYLAAISEMYE